MLFSCQNNKIQNAVNNIIKAVAQKSTVPALEGILVKAHDNTLILSAYDLELGITTQIEANIEEEGDIVFSAKLLSEILRTINSSNVKFEVDSKLMTIISSGETKFKIIGIDANEYPELPSVQKETSIEVSQKLLKKMINQTKYAVATDDNIPVHKGILFNIEDNNIKLVAVDGYRLAIRKETTANNELIKAETNQVFDFVVPGKTINEVVRLLSDDDSTVTINIGKRQIIFTIGEYSVISRLLEGEFFNYKNAIKTNAKQQVIVSTRRFIEGIDRMSLMISDKLKSPICCEISKDMLNLSCETSIGGAVDRFTINNNVDETIVIGFNNKYLGEALKACETDEVKIIISGPQQPIQIVPVNSDEFLFLVLPVRLNSEN